MSRTKEVIKETVAQVRARCQPAILAALRAEAQASVQAGILLLEVRGTFPTGAKGRASFFAWAQSKVNLGERAAYNYLRAAETATATPQAVEDTAGTIVSLAYLAGFNGEEQVQILEATKPDKLGVKTLPALKEAAGKVIERVATKNAEAAKNAEDKEVGTKVERDLKVKSLLKNHADKITAALQEFELVCPDHDTFLAGITLASFVGESAFQYDVLFYRAFNRSAALYLEMPDPEGIDPAIAEAVRAAEMAEDKAADEAAAAASA